MPIHNERGEEQIDAQEPCVEESLGSISDTSNDFFENHRFRSMQHEKDQEYCGLLLFIPDDLQQYYTPEITMQCNYHILINTN